MLPCLHKFCVKLQKSAGSLTKTGKEGWNIYDLNIMENDLLGGATSQTGIFSFPELEAVAAVYFKRCFLRLPRVVCQMRKGLNVKESIPLSST